MRLAKKLLTTSELEIMVEIWIAGGAICATDPWDSHLGSTHEIMISGHRSMATLRYVQQFSGWMRGLPHLQDKPRLMTGLFPLGLAASAVIMTMQVM